MGLSELSDSYSSSFNWLKNIWNIKTSPKIKDFLWKLVRKAIPVSANLVHRGEPPFNYKACGQEEDDLHVFLHCRVATRVWELAPVVATPPTSITSIAALIEAGHTLIALPPVGVAVLIWPWILWNLWKARTRLCFENKSFSAMEIITKSIKDAREWQEAQTSPPLLANQKPSCLAPATTRRPISPPQGTLLCHVDGAWDAVTWNCGTGGIFSRQV